MLGRKYYWFDENKELIQFEDTGDNIFERFLFKSYNLGYPIRICYEQYPKEYFRVSLFETDNKRNNYEMGFGQRKTNVDER